MITDMIANLGITDSEWRPLFSERLDYEAFRDWYIKETRDELENLHLLSIKSNPPR